jgi:hypothetical protein
MWSEVGASAEDSITSTTPITSAPYVSPHPAFSNYLTVELLVLKEMTQALADLFGLTLPVSLKYEGLVEDKL